MQDVAHIDRDERPEAPQHKHPRRHREDHEEQRRMVHDEVDTLLHVRPHAGHAFRLCRLVGRVKDSGGSSLRGP